MKPAIVALLFVAALAAGVFIGRELWPKDGPYRLHFQQRGALEDMAWIIDQTTGKTWTHIGIWIPKRDVR